ncbi:Pentatricopeptide repeat [Dillenia turbinata]|uniref:Pentatricopeptide repeat n=1 Tax=Dillenia turbinata TaxID=194707 RepID=A0AAN8V9F9_9MAGN
MAVVAPPLSVLDHRLHLRQHHCLRHQIPISITTPIFHYPIPHLSLFVTKASLSLSPQTHPSTAATSLSPPQQIQQLCQSQNLSQAYTALQKAFDTNIYTISELSESIRVLLQACGQHKDVEIGKKVHNLVYSSTHFVNDFVLNTKIITMYSLCGSPLDSRIAFDNLQRKNLFLWNALISGYTRNEHFGDAIGVFYEMLLETEFKPDNFTMPCVIKACGGIGDVGLGQSVHGMSVKLGLVLDVFVGNALVAMYGKQGIVVDALRVFENMPERNLVSWNSMICSFSENGFSNECFGVFRRMLLEEESLVPDVATLVTLLPVCAGEGGIDMGAVVHGMAVKLGLCDKLMVSNALMDTYSKCGLWSESEIIFCMIENKNVVSWNSIIGSYSREGNKRETFELFMRMQMEEKIRPNEITILNVLPVCFENSEVMCVKELHCYSLRNGIQSDEMLANAFVAAYAKCGSTRSAEHVFYVMEVRTVNSCNAIIGGHAQNGDPSKAIELFFQMTESGLDPDFFSIGSLLLACSRLKCLQYIKEVHGFILRNGLEIDSFIIISLLSCYIRCGKTHLARILFNETRDKSLVLWNAMLTGYTQNGLFHESLDLFHQMLSYGIQPSEIAITSIFGACTQLSALRPGREIHCFALKANLIDDKFVCCSLIDMYAKCGCLELSQRLEPYKAENYVLISNLYAGAGKWNDVRKVRGMMKETGLQKDVGCSWIEVEGKLYSFGVGEEILEGSGQMGKTWKRLEDKISRIGHRSDTNSVLHELEE